MVEGDPCYPNLKAIPQPVDAVVIATRPDAAEQLVHECADLGVSRVWMHRSFGAGSVSDNATNFCRERHITVIPGGCPMFSAAGISQIDAGNCYAGEFNCE